MKLNSYIGRTYEAKCGCKYEVVEMFVEVNEIKVKESKMMVLCRIDSFCDKDHTPGVTPDEFTIPIEKFGDLTSNEYAYSGPEWKLNTAETMKNRAKCMESLQKKELDIT